ncbi:MAG: proton-conducting transporter membrane subunit [Methylotenera sp.]|nr:proton-conducting transporter membrane subunit [Methylotenera sp.]
MQNVIQVLVFLPIVAFFSIGLFKRTQEKAITRITIGSIALHLLSLIVLGFLWAQGNFAAFDFKQFSLYQTDNFHFFTNFYVDRITLVFAITGAIITLLVAIFSRYYMHRDDGFKRFFTTLLLFYAGYNFVVLSGNFETLFIGWEILGITSFLLVSHYRDRYLPVKNGLKVLSLYRLGDMGLLLAMWLAHHTFQKSITFSEMFNSDFLTAFAGNTSLTWIAVLFLLGVLIKSAQLPFSSWLPRAMEGPTTSSAIFYGALSVHLGVFLLLRTYQLWHNIFPIKVAIMSIGLATSLVASNIGRVQSTVKTQIAYGTIAQVGLMLIEVALGWHTLVLIHFAGNAFLRAYQLLVSPSVLGYLIHNQFFEYQAKRYQPQGKFITKLSHTFYILGLKEWVLDGLQFNVLWAPFKWLGRQLQWASGNINISLIVTVLSASLLFYVSKLPVSPSMHSTLPFVYALIALLCILSAFAARGDAVRTWLLIVLSQLFVAVAIAFNTALPATQLLMFLCGPVLFGLLGFFSLAQAKAIDGDIMLNRFHGYSTSKPKLSLLFLISCLGLLGFPFTPTFIGIDLLFTHIYTHQTGLLALIALGFALLEITCFRIYARVFLGQNKMQSHPIAYRSS